MPWLSRSSYLIACDFFLRETHVELTLQKKSYLLVLVATFLNIDIPEEIIAL